ncbi:hypothetical protein [Anaeropeptidivorans aminofermentans]|uniref:hypothetical protein n=1 Tax=Anaeropeptidivorans aminofermentans TaxID=2934315 RepID=UPI002024253F|nr:hypothetical protein [Anaeropeptidivorans aminofermentans]
MVKSFFKKQERCKACYDFLSAETMYLGFCKKCAPKEISKLKKRIIISAVLGLFLTILAFYGIHYARLNYLISERSRDTVIIPTFFGYWSMNIRAFTAMTTLSVQKTILLALGCFLAPFGAYVRLEINTHRPQAEAGLYDLDLAAGNAAVRVGPQRIDDISLFIVSLILSALSGPFFFFYRPYKLRQLLSYMKSQ